MAMKEGGWGWVVTFSSFWVHLVTCGIAYSCGVLHQFYKFEFSLSHFETSWISAGLLGLSVLAGLPSLVLTYQMGARVTVLMGGLLATAGLVLSRFATHLYELYFTLGGLVGIGFGIALTPSVLIIQSYFYEKCTFAGGLVTSGVSFGMFALPLVIYRVFHALGVKDACLVLAAITLTLCLAALPMRPKSEVGKRREYVKMFKTELFKSVAFNCILISNFIWSFGISIIYTFLPTYVTSTGLMTAEQAAILISISGVSALCSRATFMVFSQSAKLDHCSTFLCTVVLSLIMTALFPEMFEHKAGEIGYAIILGMHCGYWSVFVGGTSDELIGQENMGYVKGYIILSIGLGLLTGPPLAGWTYDSTKELRVAFYMGGACMLFSSLVMMAVSMRKCYFLYSVDWSDSLSEISQGSQGSQRADDNKCHVGADEQQLVVTSVLSSV